MFGFDKISLIISMFSFLTASVNGFAFLQIKKKKYRLKIF